MKFKRIYILLRYTLFWLMYFFTARACFLLFNTKELSDTSLCDILLTFIYGFRLDLSTLSYVIICTIPIFIISAFFKSYKVLKISLNLLTGIIIVFFSFIIIGDAEVYKYWAFRLDSTPIQYLSTPEAIGASVSTSRLIFLSVTYLFFAISMFILYYQFVSKHIKNTKNEKFYSVIYLFIAGIFIVSMRGGIGVASINVSSAYHSNNMFLNHAAINVIWNFGSSTLVDDVNYDSLNYFNKEDKDFFFSEANQSKDTSIIVLEKQKPKYIIFIVLESFTANAIESVGGEKGLTPGLNKWSSKGILFNNFYANSDRSDKGLVSIFSSTPVLLNYSLMKNPKKSRNLPSLMSELVDNGYKSSFYYGGDINFANMQSYLKQAKFQNIISQNNLNIACAKGSKWGYHDECMFDILYNDIINENDTSVFTLFTLSSHEPYDVPGQKKFNENDDINKARNSYIYTDSCLNSFLEKLYNSPKWQNSLVILVSDHGTRFPGNVYLWDIPKFHIFMLWLGGALKTAPFVYNQTADQADISATLLSELNIAHDKFIFSENIFKKQTPSVFYSFNHGYAFIKGSEYFVYDVNTNQPLVRNDSLNNLESYAKSYMQKLSEYYKGLDKK